MIALTVRVARVDAEIVLAELLALAPAGVEERAAGDSVEFVLYGSPGELPALPALQAAAGEVRVAVSTREVPDDWAERWKSFHRPVEVAGPLGRVRVRPPWEPAAPPRAGAADIVIDPGQAFGTGAHDTTRLCLELLLALPPGGGAADWGCGSGVLAIAAAALGWHPVTAVDFDPAALGAAQANARANGVEVSVAPADLRAQPGPHAPLVLANLVRPLLLRLSERLARPPDQLIASGLLRAEADEVAAAFARHSLREAARREAGDWAALLLERVPGG